MAVWKDHSKTHKKFSPDEVYLTEDTVSLPKLQLEVKSNPTVAKWSQPFTCIIWGVLMLKTSTTGSPYLAQILNKANFVPEKKWPNSQSPSGTYSFMLLEWLWKCVALFVHRDLSIVCGTVTHSLCSFRLQEHHCSSYPTPLLFLFSSSFLKTCYQTGARR